MPVSEIDRQLDAMLGVEVNEAIPDEDEAEWTPPTPSFWYQEHERVADAFFGPTAETLTGTEALSRRIQVINDLVALCELRQPSGREQRTDWSRFEEDIDLDGADSATVESTDDTASGGSLHTADLIFPANQCMFCAFDKTLRTFHRRTKQRPDSLRRHLENQHLGRFSSTDSVTCPHEVCNDTSIAPFLSREGWLNHAAIVHKYDLKVQLNRLSSG
jgi:hypothetical protein